MNRRQHERNIFLVEQAPEGIYIARASGESIFTEADTLPELRLMVQEAVHCHFDERDTMPKIIRLHSRAGRGYSRMRLPRNLTGAELIKHLSRLGYRRTCQTGSHIRMTCDTLKQPHITVPMHEQPLRIRTLATIPSDVAEAHGMDRNDLLERLFP